MRRGSWWVATALSLCVAARAAADIGVSVTSGRAGPFDVQVLVAPAPLRVGPSEWSILVSETERGPMLRATDLELTLRAPASARARPPAMRHGDDPGSLVLRPDPAQAGGRLFRLQGVDLAVPGVWHGTLRVSREGATETLGFQAAVLPASSVLVAHWRAFAIVPGGLVIFLLHQILRRRMDTRSRGE